VQTLQTLADNGDFRASALLAKVALQATLYLEEIARRDPDILIPHAENMFMWPTVLCRKANANNMKHRWLLETLRIGARSGGGGKWQPTSAATQFEAEMASI